MKHTLDALWVIYLGIIVGGFKLLQRYFSKTTQNTFKSAVGKEVEILQTQMNLIQEGLVSLLRYRINRNTQRYLDQGYITITQRDDLEHLYNSYKALGGNGTAEALYLQCRELPTRKIKPIKEKKDD